MCSTANSRCVGVEYAHWLLSQMKTTGSRRTPAKFIASCASPRAEAPSPNQPTATRFSSRIRKASAQPTATGSIAGRWLTIAISPSRESAMWTLPSRPLRRPVGAAHVVGEDPPRLDAAGDVHAHVAVERRADVVGAHRGRDPDGRGLVPAARVERAGDLALAVEDVPALLDAARDQHVAVDRRAGPRGRDPPRSPRSASRPARLRARSPWRNSNHWGEGCGGTGLGEVDPR